MFNEKTNELRKIVAQHKQAERTISIMVETFCKDKEIPLEDRWEIFVMSGMGKEESTIVHYNTYDLAERFDFRYSVIDVVDEVNLLEESFEKEYKINQLKEEILEKFIKSFVFDW